MKIHKISWLANQNDFQPKVLHLDLDFLVSIGEPTFNYSSGSGGYTFSSFFEITVDSPCHTYRFTSRDLELMKWEQVQTLMLTEAQIIPNCQKHLMQVYEELLSAWKSPYNRQR